MANNKNQKQFLDQDGLKLLVCHKKNYKGEVE